MKKRIVLFGIIVFLASMIIGLIVGYLIKDKVVSYFKGYDSEWTVRALPKELSLEQEFAVEVWKDILNVRVSEKNEHLEKIKAAETIRLYIEVLAARIKTGKKNFKDVLVSNKDIKKALSLLNETSPIAADMFVGNWDNYCSIPEINKFVNYPETSFHVGVITKMTRTYYQF